MNVNYKIIIEYMEKHDFLQTDKKKVFDYIESYNRTTRKQFNFVNGYLTRHDLILVDGYGTKHIIDRFTLGIQENFI